ncbi:Carnosine N-methyltransferase [Psilocybe cubensis]|uniref:carnosine N-methyltransferase n=2 Tax=Psilocybe cubensis TaxID=181762 RepID=A0A8H7XRB2_PSICU|nr:Carnosine N-methyltransferase [Psilocybe cubensis]KAH9474496.1 Carnosine N-methyltransferase [Psilocybe cubensis]
MDPSIEDIEEEQRHFANVISTFNNYAQFTLSANNRRRKDVYILPKADQDLLEGLGYKEKLEAVDKAIIANADFLHQMVDDPRIFGHEIDDDEDHSEPAPHSHSHDAGTSHSHSHSHSHAQPQPGHSHSNSGPTRGKYRPTEADMDKLRSTLKQLVRDWSEEGRSEREVCYKPIKDALVKHFAKVPPEERRNLRVLVPGSGLGRLSFDVAQMGFACQANEFSHYMLLASYFILNKTDQVKQHTFYPYVHSFSNAPNRESILQAISIPDVRPSDLPAGSDFSLVAGDFEEIFANPDQKGQWNAILTCFFIDTAKNIVNYLRILHEILAPGGVWINVGPLLWHWENNNSNDPSVELDMEEVKALARKIGFEISNETTIDTTYTNNAKSLLGYVYHAAFWTATKI